MRTLTLHLVLCGILLTRAAAMPVSYDQVATRINQGQQPISSQKSDSPPAGKIPEGEQKPEFVRLADGRIVPYGPGLVCSEECVQTEALALSDEPLPDIAKVGGRRWAFVLPLAAVPLAFLFLNRDDTPRTIVSDSSRNITPTPPPTPVDVPEPATLVLLGLGLAMMARHGFGKRKDEPAQSDPSDQQ